MNKKKDFKGLTGQIMSNRPKSIEDFLSDNEGMQKNSPKDTAPADSMIQDSPINRIKMPDSPSERMANRPVSYQQTEPAEPEKTRISLYLAIRSSYELDALKTEMRRMSPRADLSKISKSSIVESAIEIVARDFRKNGLDSVLVKMILK